MREQSCHKSKRKPGSKATGAKPAPGAPAGPRSVAHLWVLPRLDPFELGWIVVFNTELAEFTEGAEKKEIGAPSGWQLCYS
jgi:hypothetical protein